MEIDIERVRKRWKERGREGGKEERDKESN